MRRPARRARPHRPRPWLSPLVGGLLAAAALPVAPAFATDGAPPAMGASPATAAVPARLDISKIDFGAESAVLENGLRIVVIPNHRSPVVTHMVWYQVGSADEAPGQSGIAHFFEHLMFKGTEKIAPGEFSRIVARLGGRDNAFTSQDYTAYFQSVARDRLARVMELEADRMRNLRLDAETVMTERDVILEERRQRIDNEPASRLREQMMAALFVNHPYGGPIIGWAPEVAALTQEDALAFYRRYYAPNNAILVVAGDVTLEEVLPLARKYYGGHAPSDLPARERPREPAGDAIREVTIESAEVSLPRLNRAYLAPSYRSADRVPDAGNDAFAAEVLAHILGGGPTSRLYTELAIDAGLAAGASAYYDGEARDLGTFWLSLSPRPGVELAALESGMAGILDDIKSDGVSETEVARAVGQMQASAIYAQDSLFALARVFGVTLSMGGTMDDVSGWVAGISAVTPADVQRVAKRILVPFASVTGYLVPVATADAPAPAPALP